MARLDADASTLLLAGLLMLAGGALHPFLPADEAAQQAALPDDAVWTGSHWALTLGQALAAVGVVGLARRVRAPERLVPLLQVGAGLAAVGFLVGVLGTLTAATALVEAARQGPEWFAVVTEGALGLGRLCMLFVGLGAALLGAVFVAEARWFGGGLVVVGAGALLAALFVPAHHPWMHDGVLRFGAVAGGVALLAAAGRVRSHSETPQA